MSRTFPAERLDLATIPATTTDLFIHEINKIHIRKLVGLDKLPLENLTLRWLSAPDLQGIPLPPGLQTLTIWHSPKLKSLAGVEKATKLKELHLRENGQLEHAKALASLDSLRVFSLEGGYGAPQKVISLKPLLGLKLESIKMVNVAVGDGDATPLAQMKSLQNIDIFPKTFPPDVLAKLCLAHPEYFKRVMDWPNLESSFKQSVQHAYENQERNSK